MANILNQLNKSDLMEMKKTIKIELMNQLDRGLNEEILKSINTALLDYLKPKIMEQLEGNTFNRNLLSNLASELDAQLGTNHLTEFENSIGTELENQASFAIKNKLVEKYSNELIDTRVDFLRSDKYKNGSRLNSVLCQ